MADTQLSEGCARRGMRVQVPPWLLFRGRLTAGRRALTPQVLARLQPPELVRYPRSVAEARRPAKAEVMQVRLLPGILCTSPTIMVFVKHACSWLAAAVFWLSRRFPNSVWEPGSTSARR